MARRAGVLAFASLLLASCSGGSDTSSTRPRAERNCPAPIASLDPAPPASTLVLYDDGGQWGWLGESYAIAAGHLASHFGPWEAHPVRTYRAGEMRRWQAIVYVGSDYDATLPAAFLEDVFAGGTPVVWLGEKLWSLEERKQAAFATKYGFSIGAPDVSRVSTIRYKGRDLTRNPASGALYETTVIDAAKVTVLAKAVREEDGSELPWALRSGDLTYLVENPFAYMTESDRYLAFADLLFDVLAPATPERHRALVRLEDVTPAADPATLRAIADLLYDQCVPFSVAVVPFYADPLGAYSEDGAPEFVLLHESEVADALRYMVASGGELVLHGYSHQYASAINPYTGTSADDFEFWMTYVDEENRVIYHHVPDASDPRYAGPVPTDSAEYARSRVNLGLAELAAAGLPAPIAFEYPHYAGSAVDSFTVATVIPTAYHRGFYFPGVLSGAAAADPARPFGQFFPYVVNDVYGWRVLPETLGNYEPEAGNYGIPPRLVPDLLRNAEANLVVRDGFASFFFHPYYFELEPQVLADVVAGVKDLGYVFVSAGSL